MRNGAVKAEAPNAVILPPEGSFFHNVQRCYNRCLGWCREVHARQPLAPTACCRILSFCAVCSLAGPSTGRAAAGTLLLQTNSSQLVWRSRFMARNRVGEGRKIGEAHRTSSNPISSGWLGAAPKSSWSTRRKASRTCTPGAFTRTRCF